MRKRITTIAMIIILSINIFFIISCEKKVNTINYIDYLEISPALQVQPILENYVSIKIIEINDKSIVQVTNNTPYILISGVYADLEFFYNKNWHTVLSLIDRTDMAREWLPLQSSNFYVNLKHYATIRKEGLYRIRKTFFLLENPREFHDVVSEPFSLSE